MSTTEVTKSKTEKEVWFTKTVAVREALKFRVGIPKEARDALGIKDEDWIEIKFRRLSEEEQGQMDVLKGRIDGQ